MGAPATPREDDIRLYIPFRPSGVGGPSVFARKLVVGLAPLGVESSFEDARGADAALVIVSAPLPVLARLRALRVPMAVRLDGVATPASTPRWRRANLRPWLAYRLADGVVFQSAYSRFLVERFLGSPGRRAVAVVHNGCDLDRFHPDGASSPLLGRGDLFSAGVFRHDQQLRPMVEALARVRRERPSCRLVVAGKVADPLRPLLEEPGVRFVGEIGNHDLPAFERAAGAFLFATLNPPCPNAVIEALGCGCPVVGYRTGSMEELVGEDGPLADHPHPGLDRFVPGDPDRLAEQVLRVLGQGEEARRRARDRAERRFGLAEMCRKYADFLARLARGAR